ncbi:MAG: hypothetical protein HY586_06170, partial [Candidatus Omnitrophica bacterium]|nr:hypothetical protein [Candidatus Omnitrophota bacterium]
MFSAIVSAKKVVAFATSFFFLANTLAYGQAPFSIMAGTPAVAAHPVFGGIHIPQEFGSIEEQSFAGLPEDPHHPFIIHIQDAHANYAAQKNTAAILEYLKKNYGFDLVLSEGALGPLDKVNLRFAPDPETNRRIAEELANQGRMTSEDLFLFGDGRGIEFEGIENPKLYREEIRHLKEVFTHRSNIESYLANEEKRLESGFSRFPRMLCSLLRLYLALDAEHSKKSFAQNLNTLRHLSQEILARDLAHAREQRQFPNLVRWFKLTRDEAKLDMKAARKEWIEIRSWVVSRGSSGSLLTTDD